MGVLPCQAHTLPVLFGLTLYQWIVSLRGRDQVQTQGQIAGCHPQETEQGRLSEEHASPHISVGRDWRGLCAYHVLYFAVEPRLG